MLSQLKITLILQRVCMLFLKGDLDGYFRWSIKPIGSSRNPFILIVIC
jgi:hypothetical protein